MKNPWMQDFLGRVVYPLNPSPEDFNIDIVAHALSLKCRFNGHTKRFYCPTSDMRILTEDLEWKCAGDLKVGSKLVAFDENSDYDTISQKQKRRIRPSEVLNIRFNKSEVFVMELSDGSIVKSTAEHPWLITNKTSNQKWETVNQIMKAINDGRRRQIHKYFEPWKFLPSYNTGWLAGMFDGEGFLSVENRRGVMLGISQNEGPCLDKIEQLLKVHSALYSKLNTGQHTCKTLQIRNGMVGILELLGKVRPMRLIANFIKALNCGDFEKQLKSCEKLEIKKVCKYGEGEIVEIETSTKTFFCEGFGSHNSVAQHAYLVSMYCPEEFALWGLLHELDEVYLPDIPSPIKSAFTQWEQITNKHMEAGAEYFGLKFPIPQEVWYTDLMLLAAEKRDLMNYCERKWRNLPDCTQVETISPWSSNIAKIKFLDRYYQLIK